MIAVLAALVHLHHQLQGLKLLNKIKRGTEDHMDHNAITVDTLLRTNDRGSIVFDFRLVNKLDREVRLNGAVVNWTYRGGMQESIGHGDIFEPTSEINIDLPLDVDEWGWLNEGSPKVHELQLTLHFLFPAERKTGQPTSLSRLKFITHSQGVLTGILVPIGIFSSVTPLRLLTVTALRCFQEPSGAAARFPRGRQYSY